MNYKIFLTIAFLGNVLLSAQTGTMKILITDKSNKETIPFANIIVKKNGKPFLTCTSNIAGECEFDSVLTGMYSVTCSYIGYETAKIDNVKIEKDKTAFVNLILSGSTSLEVVEVVSYIEPLLDVDVKSSCVVTREQYQNMATKNISSVAATTAGVSATNQGYGNRKDAMSQVESNTEEYKGQEENKFKKVKSDPFSTFSIDVDAASYSNTRRFINQGSLPPKDAVRIEEFINYFPYDYPQPKKNEPFSITTEINECPWNKNHQLIHIGLQGKKIQTDNLAANNLVFLIDVSGSMNSSDKLPLLKSALIMLVEQLRKQDKISLVVYAGQAGLILPSTSGNQKDKIIEAINNLSAGGSTAGGEGIVLAYKIAKENFIRSGNNRVLLATDGDFNVGVSNDGELNTLIEEKRNDGIFLTVLGFGTGNYKDSKMEQLADKGNGNYSYIDNILEAKKVLVKEMGATLYTIAKDVKIQVEFNPANIKAYRLIGYENRVLSDEDFNDDKKDAGEIGSGHAVTALYEIIPSTSNENVDNIDTLKYQKTINAVSNKDELMTIKFRYKEPNDTSSKLIVETLKQNLKSAEIISDNFKFATAVIEFGLLLKDSKYKGTSNYKSVIAMAKEAKGNDEDGYRAEFIRLVETAELLDKGGKRGK